VTPTFQIGDRVRYRGPGQELWKIQIEGTVVASTRFRVTVLWDGSVGRGHRGREKHYKPERLELVRGTLSPTVPLRRAEMHR
jgi:hypothetical protein